MLTLGLRELTLGQRVPTLREPILDLRVLTLGLRELSLGLRVPTLRKPTLGLRVLGLCELAIALRKLTLDFI